MRLLKDEAQVDHEGDHDQAIAEAEVEEDVGAQEVGSHLSAVIPHDAVEREVGKSEAHEEGKGVAQKQELKQAEKADGGFISRAADVDIEQVQDSALVRFTETPGREEY